MNEQLNDWDSLRWILAIARTGSLTGAARALGVSHPTVFRRINRIEQEIGVRLFERAHDGYTPTTAGEEAVALAMQLEESINGIARKFVGQDLRLSGVIRVSTTDTLLYGLLNPILMAFRREHPNVQLEVLASNEFVNLARRDADVAIRPSAAPPDILVGRKLTDIGWAIYGLPTLRTQTVAVAEVAEHSEITNDRATNSWGTYDWVAPDDSLSYLPATQWLQQHDVQKRAAYRSNTFIGMLDAARHGAGLVLLPCYLGDRDAGLVRFSEVLPDLRSELWLLTHPDLRRVARIRAFLDFVGAQLRQASALFEGLVPRQSPSAD